MSNIQQIEDAQHAAGAQREELNCIEEARASIRPADEAPVRGSGPYVADVYFAKHCNSTDAVVGEECSTRYRFEKEADRDEWIRNEGVYIYEAEGRLECSNRFSLAHPDGPTAEFIVFPRTPGLVRVICRTANCGNVTLDMEAEHARALYRNLKRDGYAA